MKPDLTDRKFETEFEFQTARSGGAGGQNVNKVSSKVILRFNVLQTTLLSEEEKKMIQEKASSLLLFVVCFKVVFVMLCLANSVFCCSES